MTRRVQLLTVALLAAACSGSADNGPRHGIDGIATRGGVPQFKHIVVVVEENRAYSDIIGSADAPYINRLAASGTLLTQSYAVIHPSEPNYLALFSGSTQGLTDDSCPHTYDTANLGAQLRADGKRFVGYAQSLPTTGHDGCIFGAYARKHAPWTNFSNLPAYVGKPMRRFPSDYTKLPKVSFVVPDLDHDMHDGSVAQADRWLRDNLRGYVRWARSHDSLLILTWDEDDRSADNHIPSVLAGAHVRQMRYRERVDHYTLLRTIEAACGLPGIGAARSRSPITAVWS